MCSVYIKLLNFRYSSKIVVLVVPTSKEGQQHIRWYVLPECGITLGKLSLDITKTKSNSWKKHHINKSLHLTFPWQFKIYCAWEKFNVDIKVQTWRPNDYFGMKVVFSFGLTHPLAKKSRKQSGLLLWRRSPFHCWWPTPGKPARLERSLSHF